MPPLLTSNVTAPLAHLPDLHLQQGGHRLQTSAVNPPTPISALLHQRFDPLLQPSNVPAPMPLILALLLQP